MKWRTENDRELGRVMDSLLVQMRDESNKAMVIWEKKLRLHVKPKPRFMPWGVWSLLVNAVIHQSSQEEFLKGSQPILMEVLNVDEKNKENPR